MHNNTDRLFIVTSLRIDFSSTSVDSLVFLRYVPYDKTCLILRVSITYRNITQLKYILYELKSLNFYLKHRNIFKIWQIINT